MSVHMFIACVAYPKVVFSSGLYGAMPLKMYRTVLDPMYSNVIDAPVPLTRIRFENICDEYELDKLPLIAHSSFDADILSSHRLERALLIDPAALPSLGASGLVPVVLRPRAPTSVICSKFYGSFVKAAFRPQIQGANRINLAYGGHSDLLDGMWPWVASVIGIDSDSKNVSKYRDFLRVYMHEWLLSSSHGLVSHTSEE